MNYLTISKREQSGGYNIGVRLAAASPRDLDLSPGEKSDIDKSVDKIFNILYKNAQRHDTKLMAAIAQSKSDLLAIFPAECGHVEIPNEYSSDRLDPWFKVFTNFGTVVVGWRSKVIEIRWDDTCIAATADDLFTEENSTKFGRLIHAWGLDKAREYINRLYSHFKDLS